MEFQELFWKSGVEDIKKGYCYDKALDEFICLQCGESFEKGIIYKFEEKLMESNKAIETHIKKVHGSMFDYLINMDKKYTGLTELQKEIMQMFYEGNSDKEITKIHGSSSSTIRTTRFALREKAKQAKIYLSIIELMEKGIESRKENKLERSKDDLIEIHPGATMVDDRYAITEEEKEAALKAHFYGEDILRLKNFPSREKKKIIILQRIALEFNPKKKYSEAEVNAILGNIYEDFATIRRYLIEYGFMERTKDCREYWIN